MVKWLLRNPGLLFAWAFCCFVLPIFIRIFVVGQEAWRFCNDRAPEGLPLVGEDVGIYVQNSWFPFGVECNYGVPITHTVFHDMGTPLLIIGVLLIGLACAGVILRMSAARRRK
jgi:hypothetical protein